ncbi:M23 family metallopeptidase [Brasilonema sp. UFV-L1]|uniref:LysM peptidoglycan-binding domain-containing M23 family metallopeptidase n=1 Tax=Brasilonema sp. UFV-L1 TaxID=2234130 RepID=UPI00145EE1DC|nr:M23 family metallopeptidase [Brasilonema sp. UFV-L1]NMG10291.1 peptidase [Brasilonema sp. UFV-L1]
MTFCYHLLLLCISIVTSTLGLAHVSPYLALAQTSVTGCQTSALERFQQHKVVPGETVESIAQRYNLTPATIIAMNPALRNGKVAVGREIQIPPYNGVIVEVPPGKNWRQIAAKYKIRPDVLFEVNGCQKNSRFVFVPKGKQSQNSSVTESTRSTSTPSQLAGYPFAEVVTVALAYGWQINPTDGKVFFHSGVDLLAAKGTSVQAIGDGTVAFATEQGTYGNLVIINHSGGLQSRYAHLDSFKVSVGQQVKKGETVGTVGTTGTPTTSQPHLHFEVRSSSSLGWAAQDPIRYLQQ